MRVSLFQLELCQEEDFYKVYEVDLHGTDITSIPDLEKVRFSTVFNTHTHRYTHTHTHTHQLH